MELARKIHKCLINGSDVYELLDLLNGITNKNVLAQINEFFMENYNKTPHEFITEKFRLEEVYAISSTLKYIREPNHENGKHRKSFYQKIGYSNPG